jgi:hypothetical protein
MVAPQQQAQREQRVRSVGGQGPTHAGGSAPHVLQLRGRADWRGAALQHVSHFGHVRRHGGAQRAHVRLAAQRVHEHGVCARICKRFHAPQRLLQAHRGASVRARHDDNVRAFVPRVARSADARNSLVARDDLQTRSSEERMSSEFAPAWHKLQRAPPARAPDACACGRTA